MADFGAVTPPGPLRAGLSHPVIYPAARPVGTDDARRDGERHDLPATVTTAQREYQDDFVLICTSINSVVHYHGLLSLASTSCRMTGKDPETNQHDLLD